jgi:phytoene dehydrogenase-like protein
LALNADLLAANLRRMMLPIRVTSNLEYDGIRLGAGHNCLILQAYLGLAGLRTICLERRQDADGGLCTIEDPRYPEFLHNTHSFFHRAIRQMPWFHDPDLEKRGAHYIVLRSRFGCVGFRAPDVYVHRWTSSPINREETVDL